MLFKPSRDVTQPQGTLPTHFPEFKSGMKENSNENQAHAVQLPRNHSKLPGTAMKESSVLSLALPLIRKYEGLGDGDKALPGLQPYLCPAGVWTLGYGSTRDANRRRVTKHSGTIMPQEADALLARDTRHALAAVLRQVRVPLSSEEAAALTSFTFNLGAGALASSTLLKRVNTEDREDVPRQLRKWVYAGGRILPGLIRRRNEEAMLWQTPS